MAVLVPIKEIEVADFNEFCETFNIKTEAIAGNNGSDDELIIEELNKLENENWVVNFICDRMDGYFRLQLFN